MMKIVKLITIALLGAFFSASLLAQENQGIDLLRLGEFDLAKQFFIEGKNMTKAESLYFQGEVAWEEGNTSEATAKYNEALSADPLSLYAQLGVAKSQLKSADPKEAKKTLENLYKKNKKDIKLVLEVAKAFFDNGMEEEGNKAIEEARKSDKTSPLIYILLGDRELKKGKVGDAAMQYDQALNFDSNNVLARIKAGKVYENINKNIASEHLKKAQEVDPNNRMVNRSLGKIYSASGRHADAIKIYADYFMNGGHNLDDIRNFGYSLYFNKNYSEAEEILGLGLKESKDDFVFNRLMMYTDYELKKYNEGVEVGKHFFSLRSDSGYIDKDYITYGHLLTETGDKEGAMQAYTKAVEINPSNIELYKELASSMSSDKLYEGAAEFLNKYIEAVGADKAEQAEFYQLGRYYQSAAAPLMRDSLPEIIEKRVDLLQKADAAFTVVTEKLPDNYIGYYMRANTNAMIDPQLKDGLARPFYEKTLELIQAAGELDKRQNVILPAYEYLAMYYYFDFADNNNKESKVKAQEYCDLYLAIDPTRDSILRLAEAMK